MTQYLVTSNDIKDTYTPFVFSVDGTHALTLHEDLSVTVDWNSLRNYASVRPVTSDLAGQNDFTARCVAHALLAVRDGRVTEVVA